MRLLGDKEGIEKSSVLLVSISEASDIGELRWRYLGVDPCVILCQLRIARHQCRYSEVCRAAYLSVLALATMRQQLVEILSNLIGSQNSRKRSTEPDSDSFKHVACPRVCGYLPHYLAWSFSQLRGTTAHATMALEDGSSALIRDNHIRLRQLVDKQEVCGYT